MGPIPSPDATQSRTGFRGEVPEWLKGRGAQRRPLLVRFQPSPPTFLPHVPRLVRACPSTALSPVDALTTPAGR
jgi:hypothetical protein